MKCPECNSDLSWGVTLITGNRSVVCLGCGENYIAYPKNKEEVR